MNIEKIKEVFPAAIVNKSASTTTLMNFLDLPSDVRNWLLSRFTSKDTGKLNAYRLSEYVKEMRLKPNDWNLKLLEATHTTNGQIRCLTKISIEFDYANETILFSLPEYGFPKKRGEALVDWSVISSHKKHLLNSNGVWGEILIAYQCGVVQLVSFKPLCPYTADLKRFQENRKKFTTEEWIDILLSGLNFNPDGFSEEAKLTLLQRFLPFVEKRLNQIELAIKGSAKSYCYSQLSPYNWLTSGTITRATAFYNATTKKTGYFSQYDNVIWDEVQTIKCNNPEEMNGTLKPYLESGEIRIGNYCGMSDAGLTLVGNIPVNEMSLEEHNMFNTIGCKMFKESAFIDRFSGIIEGWKIGRFTEDRKYEGWGLSANYLTEIFHLMRDEFYYRAIIDEMLYTEGNCDTRNFEAVKKNAAAFLKLLFPHITSSDEIDIVEFRKYCLEPAIRMRWGVLCQLRFLDAEYENVEMPTIKIVGEDEEE